MLHGIQCIQSGCFWTCCKKSTAVNRDAFGQASKNPLHSIMLPESTAFNHTAWNPLHSTGFNFFMLHGINCIQSCCMESTAFNWDAFYQAAWITLHSITLHGIHCVNDAAWNTLPSIGMLLAMVHKIHCIQSCCMVSNAFNRDVFGHAA